MADHLSCFVSDNAAVFSEKERLMLQALASKVGRMTVANLQRMAQPNLFAFFERLGTQQGMAAQAGQGDDDVEVIDEDMEDGGDGQGSEHGSDN